MYIQDGTEVTIQGEIYKYLPYNGWIPAERYNQIKKGLK